MARAINQIVMLSLLFLSFITAAANTYSIKNGEDSQELADYQYLSKEVLAGLTVEEIANLRNDEWQQSIGSPVIYEGENWLRFTIDNNKNWQKGVSLLIKSSPYISSISVFSKTDTVPIYQRSLKSVRNNYFEKKFYLASQSQLEVYLHIKTDLDTPLLVSFTGLQRYVSDIRDLEFAKGIALGGYVFLSVALLLVFLAVRRTNLLVLSAYFSSQTLMLFVLFGNNFVYFFPELPALRGAEIPFLVAFSSFLLIWFTADIFSLKRQLPHLYKQLRYTCIVLPIYVIVSLQLSISHMLTLSMLIDSTVAMQLLYTGICLTKKQVALARWFTLCMIVQFVLGVVFSSGIFWHSNEIFNYSDAFLSVSFWINALLLTFVVSRVFYLQIKDKEQAQKEVLKVVLENKKNQKKLLELKEENELELENRVQERTLELNIAFQELEELNKELAAKSTTDDLTGLYNRRFYDQKILAEFRRSRRNLTPLSLIVVDVDHFKKVNDSMGHLAGDECLIALGKHLKQSLRRSSDVSCRYGGEEFCLILPETTSAGAKALAEEIRHSLEMTPVHHHGKIINLTISCGFATYTQQKNIEAADLFLAADKALYIAKHNGRNQSQEYNLANLKT